MERSADGSWWYASLVVALAAACYLPSLSGGLVYDDRPAILQNAYVTSSDVIGVFSRPSWAVWTGFGYAGYRPVTTATFLLNWLLGGANPFGFHLVNLLLHVSVSLLVLAVLTRALGDSVLATSSALLFAAHPIHTEAVASVVGRAETIAAALGLLAWYVVASSQSLIRVTVATALVFLATLGKENAAAIPAVVVLSDLLLRPPGTRGKRPCWTYGALFLGALAALGIRASVLSGLGSASSVLDNPLVGEPTSARLFTTCRIVGLYAWTLLLPLHLSADHSYADVLPVHNVLDPPTIFGIVTVVGLVLLAIQWRRHPIVAFASAYLLTTSAIALGATFFGVGAIVAERFMYLPSLGFCLLVSLVLARGGKWIGLPDPARAALLGLFLAGYAARAIARCAVWHDPLSLAESLVRDAPRSARAHRELAVVAAELRDDRRAQQELEAALAILPGDATTLYNYGNLLLRVGRPADAIRSYRAVLEQVPTFVEALDNLGNAHSALGDQDAAERSFRQALEQAPTPDRYMNLGNSLLRLARPGEAEPLYREAIRQAPRSPLGHFNFGVCLESLGRPGEAASEYAEAVTLQPTLKVAHARLISALLAAGQVDEARHAWRRADAAFPGDAAIAQLGGQLP